MVAIVGSAQFIRISSGVLLAGTITFQDETKRPFRLSDSAFRWTRKRWHGSGSFSDTE